MWLPGHYTIGMYVFSPPQMRGNGPTIEVKIFFTVLNTKVLYTDQVWCIFIFLVP